MIYTFEITSTSESKKRQLKRCQVFQSSVLKQIQKSSDRDLIMIDYIQW